LDAEFGARSKEKAFEEGASSAVCKRGGNRKRATGDDRQTRLMQFYNVFRRKQRGSTSFSQSFSTREPVYSARRAHSFFRVNFNVAISAFFASRRRVDAGKNG
jgi:hypothetical protein